MSKPSSRSFRISSESHDRLGQQRHHLHGQFHARSEVRPVQPYGTIGFGLIKTHTDLTLSDLIDNDQNDFGWNTGGGLMIHFSDHFGVRGDVRYFHAFSRRWSLLGLNRAETKLDYGRFSGALLVKF